MAYRLNLMKKNGLVTIHVLSIIAWFGGAMCMLILGLYMKNAKNGEQLFYILSDMHLIDITLIRYPALVVLISGVLLSIWTHWGLVKYYWVIIKLILTILIIIIGIIYLSDWLSFLIETADRYRFNALQKSDFQRTSSLLILTSLFNILAMAIMTGVTYFKPFGKIK
ncbi:hypothetical protein [Thermoflavimicrobium daqui]|jgi:uncharacterized membrane protein|uniref:DUF2269 family protein n=1 Tax=Thermoflavimicrobium daqui TaxID=2137476 RepID=A0A364K407_9BACL|nr:hypothetical protein [Thermoflavimicrobium daqui]RAL24092.1 hypothetical protein DL897_10380 [Thermoflavimicrobium daqui]